METTYKRELGHNYLILWQEEVQACYQLGMLTRNRIPGLLECKLSMLDEKTGLYYEITSRQSLRLLLERKRLTAQELRRLLKGLQKVVEVSREYLLDSEHILLSPDYIYLEPDAWEPAFCYCPFYEQDMQETLLQLAEYFLERLDRQDQNAVALGYEFYRMAGEANVSLERLLSHWKEEEKRKESPEAVAVKSTGNPVPQNPPAAGKETVFLAKGKEEELVLRSKHPACPDLKIAGESFLIGKKKDAVDGLLKVRGISRIHARITKEEGLYYLTDLNSTNGTFLNGGRLGVNERARIRPGDCVGFADVEYRVGLNGE